MKILVVGSGGREHAIAWRLAQDKEGHELYCAPGNAGTAAIATNVAVAAEDIDGVVAWATANHPDLVVVGPEAPLVKGLVDALQKIGVPAFGPVAAGARMEGSKRFAKEVMDAAGVPTGKAEVFTDAAAAKAALPSFGLPVVIKADGLGEECSILALVDGENAVLLPSSQDHKRVFDGDKGPNTGGMGAYSPAPVVTADRLPEIKEKIILPVVRELKKRGIVYRGVLYAGLMVNNANSNPRGPLAKSGSEVNVVEFNARFGDPETEAVLPRLGGSFAQLLLNAASGSLSESDLVVKDDVAATVIVASGGYPGDYEKGKEISGLAAAEPGAIVFHCGTKEADGRTLTSGGRVLSVTGLGATLREAVDRAYARIAGISFDKMFFRRDIAHRAFERESARQ